MRCIRCGMPLSPSHTHCARCGTAVKAADAQGSGQNQVPENRYGAAGANVGVGVNQPAWGQQAPATPWNTPQMPFTPPMSSPPYQQNNNNLPQQVPFPQMTPPPGAPATNVPHPWQQQQQTMQGWPSASPVMNPSSQTPSPQPYVPQPASMPVRPQPFVRPIAPQSTRKRSKASQGFIIAALCVLTGGLILVFVYVMSLGLPTNTPGITAQSKAQPTAVTKNVTPTPSPDTTASPTPVASPTPTYPGQQYIDNAQMASQVNTRSALPMVQTTDFKVGQQVFVTFALHPSGHPGAVCLLWYFNNKQYTHFEFFVNGVSSPAYSYTFANAAGPAYVEVYWASSTACTDKILAQHVDFTVSA